MGTWGGLAMRLWALCGHSEKVSTVFLAPHMSIHRQIWAVFLKNWGKFGCEFIVKGESKKQNKTIFQPTRGGGYTPKLLSEFEFETIRAAFAARRFALQMGKKRNRHISF